MLLALVGDVMLGRGVAVEIGRRRPDSFWGDTLPLLRSAALVVAGLECAITTYPVRWTRTPKGFPIRPDPATLEVVERTVDQARALGAECVILSLHWGPNMVQRPPARFRQFARAVLERGVDMVYGHSAHIFQGVEIYHDKPILYDTG